MKTLKWYWNCFLFLFSRRLLSVRPSKKNIFLIPAPFIFWGRLPFLFFFLGKVGTKKNHATSFTLNTIILQSYVAGLTFHKTKFYIDLFNTTYLLRHIVWCIALFKTYFWNKQNLCLFIFDRMTPTYPWGRVIIFKKIVQLAIIKLKPYQFERWRMP